MSEEKDSLIFIPDISGFTHFVNTTEITHSQHIISELLENIIASNDLGMEISEVEGDAIVFYKHKEFPPLEDVILQAKQMFVRFHEHLQKYETQRICQCGACSSAAKLTLKFIIHRGTLGFTTIRNQRKPFGLDIVLVHKLLKNDIRDSEYILVTDSASANTDLSSMNDWLWETFKNGVSEYDQIGKVNYSFMPLAKLHNEVPPPTPIVLPEKMKKPVSGEINTKKSLLESYELLSNFDLKPLWQNDVKELSYDKNKVNRIGTKHICVFEKGKANFESVTNDFGSNKLVYGERLLNFPLARELTFYFILEPMDDGTNIRTEIHYRLYSVFGKLFEPIIRMNSKKIIQNFISSFPKE
jgi:hypothetical protein